MYYLESWSNQSGSNMIYKAIYFFFKFSSFGWRVKVTSLMVVTRRLSYAVSNRTMRLAVWRSVRSRKLFTSGQSVYVSWWNWWLEKHEKFKACADFDLSIKWRLYSIRYGSVAPWKHMTNNYRNMTIAAGSFSAQGFWTSHWSKSKPYS